MESSQKHFLIIALPRSRTAWLAAFFSSDDVACYHDPLMTCAHPGEIARYYDKPGYKAVGAADTGAVLFLDRIRAVLPDLKLGIVLRSRVECEASLSKTLDIHIDLSDLEAELERVRPDAHCIHFDELDDPERMSRFYTEMTGQPFPRDRFELFRGLNIQVRPEHFWADFKRNQQGIMALMKEAVWRGG